MPTRRELLLHGALALAFTRLGACGRVPEPLPPGAIRVPLAELPDGLRVRRMRGGEPVELVRTGPSVTARSLYCTHFGCRLAWNDEAQRYLCPCHGGEFDSAGAPVAGPAREPLRALPVRMETDAVVVLPRGPLDRPR